MMIRPRLQLLLLLAAAACDGRTASLPTLPPPAPLPPPNSTLLDGSWRAIYWLAMPASGAVMDVWELGGRLDLQIVAGHVTGTMNVPPDVTQGGPASADMAGVVLVDGDSARFVQSEDTFVRRATWKVLEDALVLADHDVEGTRFTVVLVRGW
jgi:hypothetical protein